MEVGEVEGDPLTLKSAYSKITVSMPSEPAQRTTCLRRRRRRRRKMAHRRYCGRQPPSPQASPSSSDAVIAALREGFERASN